MQKCLTVGWRAWAAPVLLLPYLIAGSFSSPAYAQIRVTLVTKTGESIEAMFKGASASEVVLEVAGQELRVPIVNVKYVAFSEKPAETGNPQTVRAVDDAIAALEDVQFMIGPGAPPPASDYSAKVTGMLPRVLGFTRNGKGWGDVRLLLGQAAEIYRNSLQFLDDDWEDRGPLLRSAAEPIRVAKSLAALAGEESHQEDPAVGEVVIGAAINGRLGAGDQTMAERLDPRTAGAFNDVYRIDIKEPITLSLAVKTDGCLAHLVLADALGRAVATSAKFGEPATQTASILKAVRPGAYSIWVGTTKPLAPGLYSFTVKRAIISR